MASFTTWMYILCFILAILTFLVAAWVTVAYMKHSVFPRAIRLFLRICLVPHIFSVSLCTAIVASSYLFNWYHALTIDLVSIVLAFSCQMIRSAFLFTIIERIIATVYWNRYQMSSRMLLFWIMTVSSFVTATAYITLTLINRYDKYGKNQAIYLQILTYYVFGMHIFTFVICLILYFLNKKMYKVKAYRTTLKQRHQIMENVKVLQYLFPAVFLHTCISPLGSVISIIDSIVDFIEISPPILPIFYNLSLLLICIRHIFVNTKLSSEVSNGTVVKNALGKSLPKMFTTDNYFRDLQHQWK